MKLADRMKRITGPSEIDAWLDFDFSGRGDSYSKQKYHWYTTSVVLISRSKSEAVWHEHVAASGHNYIA